MVRSEGFEPPTFWFVAKHSIQLSYARIDFVDIFILTQKKKFSSFLLLLFLNGNIINLSISKYDNLYLRWEMEKNIKQKMEILTEQEINILKLILMGYTTTQIGKMLYISQHTVKVHVSAILRKLGARNRAHAAFIALDKGIINLKSLHI